MILDPWSFHSLALLSDYNVIQERTALRFRVLADHRLSMMIHSSKPFGLSLQRSAGIPLIPIAKFSTPELLGSPPSAIPLSVARLSTDEKSAALSRPPAPVPPASSIQYEGSAIWMVKQGEEIEITPLSNRDRYPGVSRESWTVTLEAQRVQAP